MRAGEEAEKKGFAQVLWLDGVNMKYIEEVGAMNVMFKINGKVVTPDISGGTVLPRHHAQELHRGAQGLGATRLRSATSPSTSWSRPRRAARSRRPGAAAPRPSVSPMGVLAYKDVEHVINNNEIGPLTQRLYDELTGIQWGKVPDTRGWIVKVC